MSLWEVEALSDFN